jgi:hypothetical protein
MKGEGEVKEESRGEAKGREEMRKWRKITEGREKGERIK